jgi:hypothetical protein
VKSNSSADANRSELLRGHERVQVAQTDAEYVGYLLAVKQMCGSIGLPTE